MMESKVEGTVGGDVRYETLDVFTGVENEEKRRGILRL